MSSTSRRIRFGTFALAATASLLVPAAARAQNQAIVLKPQSPPPAHERQALRSRST